MTVSVNHMKVAQGQRVKVSVWKEVKPFIPLLLNVKPDQRRTGKTLVSDVSLKRRCTNPATSQWYLKITFVINCTPYNCNLVLDLI